EEGPALSAIVIAHDEEDRIEASVGSVVAQECPEPFEVVVVASGSDGTAAVVRERFPQVAVIELPGRALPGAARNAALRIARHHLLQVGGFPEQMRAGEDTLVNRELARLGYGAYRAADVRLYHRSPCTNAARLVAHHFTRGRALARIVLDDGAPVVRNVLLEY